MQQKFRIFSGKRNFLGNMPKTKPKLQSVSCYNSLALVWFKAGLEQSNRLLPIVWDPTLRDVRSYAISNLIHLKLFHFRSRNDPFGEVKHLMVPQIKEALASSQPLIFSETSYINHLKKAVTLQCVNFIPEK